MRKSDWAGRDVPGRPGGLKSPVTIIAEQRFKRLESEQALPPPAAPLGASSTILRLHEAAREMHEQKQGSPDDWRAGWEDYKKALGVAIRANQFDSRLVQEYLAGLRTFADKATLDKFKNKVGRIPVGGHDMLSHGDFWIAYHASEMRERGYSVARIRNNLLTKLPQRAFPKGCDLSDDQRCRLVGRITAKLLGRKVGSDLATAKDSDGRGLEIDAQMKAIAILWQADIRQRLGTQENLRLLLHRLGIAVER